MHSGNEYRTFFRVTLPDPPDNPPPPAAPAEFTEAARAGWERGVPLAELLERVNRAAAGFLPAEAEPVNPVNPAEPAATSGRVRRAFTERSFRHYQTARCIDPPDKSGRRAGYGFRHFVQALLVRKLLWERVPAERIAPMLADRGTGELERMLLGGVEMVARPVAGADREAEAGGPAETWTRLRVVPGVELHLRGGLRKPTPEELERWLALLANTLRGNF